jgi:low affinity Fe/Cu permease
MAFALALFVVIAWAVSGPMFDFSSTWQLFINTFTTIMTFLMVFLIQNTQNRDGKAVQLKLDELLLSTRGRDAFVDLEDMTDDELAELDREFREIHDKQATSRTMKKLHAKVEVEHAMRQKKNIFAGMNLLSRRNHKED